MSFRLVLLLLFVGTISGRFRTEREFTVKQSSLFNTGRSYTITEVGSSVDRDERNSFTIKNELLSIGKKLVLLDNGRPLYELKHKLGHIRQEWHIYDAASGDTIATFKHEISVFHDSYKVESTKFGDFHIEGNIVGRTFTVKQGGHAVAEIHKDRLHLHDTYTVKIAEGQDPAIILMIAIGIDEVREH